MAYGLDSEFMKWILILQSSIKYTWKKKTRAILKANWSRKNKADFLWIQKNTKIVIFNLFEQILLKARERKVLAQG